MHKIKLQPDQTAIPHMEHVNVMSRWQKTKPHKYPKLELEAALCHDTYGKICLKAQNKAGAKHTTEVAAMSDTGAPMCLIGRCVTMQMGITRHNHANTTEKLVGANGGKIKLDGAVILNLTLGDTTSSQLPYVMPQVTCLFLFQRVCKELRAMHLDFLA